MPLHDRENEDDQHGRKVRAREAGPALEAPSSFQANYVSSAANGPDEAAVPGKEQDEEAKPDVKAAADGPTLSVAPPRPISLLQLLQLPSLNRFLTLTIRMGFS
jgi:hypothetical protein